MLIIDSDMVLDKNVVAQCVALVARGDVIAAVIPERSEGQGFWAACKALERSCYVGDDTIEAARFFTRDAVRSRHGGYDEDMILTEDRDLPARIGRQEGIGRVDAEIAATSKGSCDSATQIKEETYAASTWVHTCVATQSSRGANSYRSDLRSCATGVG